MHTQRCFNANWSSKAKNFGWLVSIDFLNKNEIMLISDETKIYAPFLVIVYHYFCTNFLNHGNLQIEQQWTCSQNILQTAFLFMSKNKRTPANKFCSSIYTLWSPKQSKQQVKKVNPLTAAVQNKFRKHTMGKNLWGSANAEKKIAMKHKRLRNIRHRQINKNCKMW